MLWYHVLTILSLSLSKHFPCRLLLAVPVEPKCCSPASTNVCSGFLAPLLSVPYHALNVYSKGMHDFSAYVAPATLVMLQRCKFLDSIQVPFSLGVFLIALFFWTIFTVFLCSCICLVFPASPGVTTAAFAVNVSFAQSSKSLPGFRWAWNLHSWARNRSLCLHQYHAGYRCPWLCPSRAAWLCERCKW